MKESVSDRSCASCLNKSAYQRHHGKITFILTFFTEVKLCLRLRGHDCENTLKTERDHTNVNIVKAAKSLGELYKGRKQNKWKRHG